jgi:NAD(P)H-dependent FMN reductase
MKILVLNGSPRKKGIVATLLRNVADGFAVEHEIEWTDVYDLEMKPCIACMRCRPDGECVLTEDDAHKIGRKIKNADILLVGTPTHWGNMSAQLKLLFDRNVPVFMGKTPNDIPLPRQKGKPAVIVSACNTPWPFNFINSESRGAVKAVRKVLNHGGYKIIAVIVKPGSRKNPHLSQRLLKKARGLGKAFN